MKLRYVLQVGHSDAGRPAVGSLDRWSSRVFASASTDVIQVLAIDGEDVLLPGEVDHSERIGVTLIEFEFGAQSG